MHVGVAPTGTTEMPKYRCFKEVHALKIERVEDAGTDTTTDENPIVICHFVDKKFVSLKFNLRGKPTPEDGWWMVQYEDGYTSFSPARAFEEGYMDVRLIPKEPTNFKGELTRSINKYSIDNDLNTPDFILALYVEGCLNQYSAALSARERWYGRGDQSKVIAAPTQ